ncbi:START-2 domain-containing protein, putative [Babesia ovata]|uniref:START-2 domain-containing protein, putative n=1 Tax=Babesia ovata TaxID=189622 RepID=A0A2H6KHW9_9APIC|nr:START-2 domain-containing protein, putative [Babesia ovata]GBE62588.1 START-2 domain-containing protein, putative [Babesia ovata]
MVDEIVAKTAQPDEKEREGSCLGVFGRSFLQAVCASVPFKNVLFGQYCQTTEPKDDAMEEVDYESADEQPEVHEPLAVEDAERECQIPELLQNNKVQREEPGACEAVSVTEPQPVQLSIDLPNRDVDTEGVTKAKYSFSKSRTITLEEYPRDEKLAQRAVEIFVENSISFAKSAIEDSKVILADKIICQMLQKVHEIYGDPKAYELEKAHPLVNVMERLPEKTPETVRSAIETVANDKIFMTNVAEKLLVLDIFNKFNMVYMKTHIINYRQHFISKLWPSALETASYELKSPRCPSALATERPSNDVEYIKLTGEEQLQTAREEPEVHRSTPAKQVVVIAAEKRQPKAENGGESKPKQLKTSRYFSYASRFMSRKNTMFGQHFGKNKVKTADGWIVSPYGSLETFYRFESNGSVSVKVRGKLATDLLRVLCVINETDLSAVWVPFLKEAKEVHVYSRTTKLYSQTYEYPVIGAKQTSVFGLAVNALDEFGCFILACRAPPESPQDVKQLEGILKEGGIEDTSPFVSCKDGICQLMGVDIAPMPPKTRQRSGDLCFLVYPMKNHTLVELNANIIPEVRLVPARVVTYIIKKVVVNIFQKIAQISKNFHQTPFAERIEQNKEFYDWVAKLHDKYVGRGDRQNCKVSICTYDTNLNEP